MAGLSDGSYSDRLFNYLYASKDMNLLLPFLLRLLFLQNRFHPRFIKPYDDLSRHLNHWHGHLTGLVDHYFPGGIAFGHVMLLIGYFFLFEPFFQLLAPGTGGGGIDDDFHNLTKNSEALYIFFVCFTIWLAKSGGSS